MTKKLIQSTRCCYVSVAGAKLAGVLLIDESKIQSIDLHVLAPKLCYVFPVVKHSCNIFEWWRDNSISWANKTKQWHRNIYNQIIWVITAIWCQKYRTSIALSTYQKKPYGITPNNNYHRSRIKKSFVKS